MSPQQYGSRHIQPKEVRSAPVPGAGYVYSPRLEAWVPAMAADEIITSVGMGDSASTDSLRRLRAVLPYTIFDSKLLTDAMPLFWDDQQVSGAGTTSVWNAGSYVEMGVAAATAGKRVRQTFMRFNYQPGKSQLAMLTGVLVMGGGGAGIDSMIGIGDANNGLFFEHKDGIAYVVRINAGAITRIPQGEWNWPYGDDPADVVLDWTKSHIFVLDYEWFGVGPVRWGIWHENRIIYVHRNTHDNQLIAPYMASPNLPLRYSIENTGAGPAEQMRHICSTVISEGGQEKTGKLHYDSTSPTHVDADVAGIVYAVLGIRLKSTHLSASIDLSDMSMINLAGDDYEWELRLKPTVTGVFTYADVANSAVQSAKGATANVVTVGTRMGGGFVKGGGTAGEVSSDLENAIRLGAAIDGTRDTVVLCVRPLTNGANIHGSLGWRELQ